MYTTELMQNIVTSPEALKALGRVSPIYGNGYVALWLYQAIGLQMDEVRQWAEEIALQTNPQTATWSIPMWEESLGVVSEPTWTLERRRQNVMNKKLVRAPMNPAKLAKLVTVSAGANAKIKEYTGKNHFTVYISSVPSMVNEELVRKDLDRTKPSHLIYTITYEQSVPGVQYFGGITQQTKTITLRQV